MNRLGFLLLAALSAKSALAGEVGARNPQYADRAELAVAVVDLGVSANWKSAPISKKASAENTARLQNLNEEISAQVSDDLTRRIAEQMELSYTH